MLKDLDLHIGYNSEESENILKDFYIPVLSNSKEYWRLTGYFSSGSIRVAAIGIRRLIQNGGTMKLVTLGSLFIYSAVSRIAIPSGLLGSITSPPHSILSSIIYPPFFTSLEAYI